MIITITKIGRDAIVEAWNTHDAVPDAIMDNDKDVLMIDTTDWLPTLPTDVGSNVAILSTLKAAIQFIQQRR